MEGFKAIGYDDVAPQAILAHEYGHQVQFQLGMFGDGTPAGTRRLELMADALSAYYLSHIRGEFMRWSRYKKFLKVFFLNIKNIVNIKNFYVFNRSYNIFYFC